MRFGSRSPAPNYLGRREQRRLLAMILLLGLVLLLMREASKPGNWNWFVALNNPQPAGKEIDTRLSPAPQTETPPGSFTSPREKPALARVAKGRFVSIDPQLLEPIRDDTVFRAAEHDAFFYLFDLLRSAAPGSLAAGSLGPTAFVQLYQQSEEYRGKLVTVRGTVRGVFEVPAADNVYGIAHYYQTWIQPHDNPELPLVVYALELPPGFPIAERLHEEVEVTGFFFKRWAYQAQDAIRSAPLVLAKTVEWQASPTSAAPPIGPGFLAGLVACAGAIAAVFVWMASRGAARAYSGPIPPRRYGDASDADVSPAETLQRLAEQAEADRAAATKEQGTAP